MKSKLILTFLSDLKAGFRQSDKRKHLYVGFIIAFVMAGITTPGIGAYTGCVAASLKEWHDSKGHGTVESMDVIFTQMGAALGALSFWLLSMLF